MTTGQLLLWILGVSILLYFVIKWGVKNGINESLLISEEARRKNQQEREVQAQSYWNDLK
ncbi:MULTISPECIES: DUF6019 family protein [unclassified Psychrobacillus]|uniref:DUF6019 family protein n=1 Tax=unclassified Psychrobacillus TaxID=2636677 RepID=UPI0011A30154|nr:DUF6019 family protein [Psychrobacillus sp. AK 1817]QEY20974.1 hypothetical protein D0S48_09840 [Psychrobacillus sp. AK 1817]QGM31483.1 hypothetical protein GI482_14300 [Bacillus sp. N3536]